MKRNPRAGESQGPRRRSYVLPAGTLSCSMKRISWPPTTLAQNSNGQPDTDLQSGLGEHCRHLLLMTATPHNGKEEDFQLFLSLLDADRFYGKFRDGVHKVDASDLMQDGEGKAR